MRDLLRVGAVLLLLVTVLLAGRSWSDTKAPAPRPRSRIAVLNIQYVIKNWKQFEIYNGEMKKALKPYQDKDASLKATAEKASQVAQDNTAAAEQREQAVRELKDLRRAVDENKAKAQKELGKLQEQQLKSIYQAVEEVTRRYARDHDLDLVLHYLDSTGAERSDPRNIARKMQTNALFPLYTAPGLDITKEILAALNDKARREK
jgi:Skp family chaperone for outer membrane proteins